MYLSKIVQDQSTVVQDQSKKYHIENIRIKFWRIFLDKCTSQIMKILIKSNTDIAKYKLEQKILNYNTYLLGKCELSSYALFPKKKCINDYKKIFKYDISYNWKISDSEFNQIIHTFISINHECKHDMKNEIEITNFIKVNPIIQTNNDNIVILTIGEKKFKLSKKHYNRLQSMFIGNKSDTNIMICILLTRYEYYGILKEGICLSTNDVYEFIHKEKIENKTLEAFAGTLNSNLSNYCSLFYDIEKKFGSKGSFFNISIDKYDIIISNPPYITSVMDDSSHLLVNFLKLDQKFVIVIIPDWRSVDEYNKDSSKQISINEHMQERAIIPYNSYKILRTCKYFDNVICIGNYMYYNYFSDSQKKIRDNVLFVTLSSNKKNNFSKKFSDFMIKKINKNMG